MMAQCGNTLSKFDAEDILLCTGRWVYRLVAAIEANTSGLGFLIFYALLVASLHFLTWLSWKAAHLAVVLIAMSSSPKPKPT
jgi:hypothetical protein